MREVTGEYDESDAQPRGAATRARLLAAATAEFAAHGYHSAKVSNIVRACGVTQPSFYLYFESKAAIFEELIETFRGYLREILHATRLRAMRSAPELAAQMRSNLTAIYRLAATHRDLTRIALIHNPNVELIRIDLTTLFYHELQLAQTHGVVRHHLDLEVVTVGLVGLLERLLIFWVLEGEKDPEELAISHTDLVLRGILT